VCFHGGYDEERIQAAINERGARETQKQACAACPADIMDDGCLTCLDGVATITPGFTIPPVASNLGRRMLLDSGTKVQTLFRCHLEMDLAIKRCPGCADPPCDCAEGYSGNVCNECIEGHGMSASTRTCEPCEGTGYTPDSLLLLVGILAAVILVIFILLKVWKVYLSKRHIRWVNYLARCY
jgi:hypothetical protein